MLLSAVSVLVVAQSSSEIPEGLMNNPVQETLPACALSHPQSSSRSRWPHAEQELQTALECQVEAKEVSCRQSEL